MSKLVLVSGATGAQGGSVVRALLKDGNWKVRAITRDVHSVKAKELQQQGVEVVKANLNDPNELRAALKDASAFFAVTNFWDPENMGQEFEQGKIIVDLCREIQLQHLVFSSLPNVRDISGGKWDVPHFTDKALVEEYARNSGVRATFVQAGFYFENFKTFFQPREENGTFVFTLPMPEDKWLDCLSIEDIGEVVRAVLNDPDQWLGKTIPVASERLHPTDFVKTWSEVKGTPARFKPVSVESFSKLEFSGARELAQMFGFFNEYTFFGPNADISIGKKLNPHMKNWKQFVQHELA